MRRHNNLDVISLAHGPIALSIGNFDGVHLGHQAVLNRLKEAATQTVVLTFSNHPAEVLSGSTVLRLTTLSHRLMLLEKMGIDHVIVIPFSKEFSRQSAADFLSRLKEQIPFSNLILGYDASIGHDRNQNLQSLCAPLSFSLEYQPPVQQNSQIISSSLIRQHIQKGELSQTSALLGRPYSIYSEIQTGHGNGKKIGFPTANLSIEGLALPPFGVYAVDVIYQDEKFLGVANLGYAPTLHPARAPCLEVHLIATERSLYGQTIEVIFKRFIREEKRFESKEALQSQIQHDIQAASI
jgi:riboflavin kinase / FMN adenylyltransferase